MIGNARYGRMLVRGWQILFDVPWYSKYLTYRGIPHVNNEDFTIETKYIEYGETPASLFVLRISQDLKEFVDDSGLEVFMLEPVSREHGTLGRTIWNTATEETATEEIPITIKVRNKSKNDSIVRIVWPAHMKVKFSPRVQRHEYMNQIYWYWGSFNSSDLALLKLKALQ